MFFTAFVLKHILLASLYSSEGGWFKRLAGTLLQGVTLGTLETPTFAPVTGYIGFFTLALYIAGLILLAFAAERLAVREAILGDPSDETEISIDNRRIVNK